MRKVFLCLFVAILSPALFAQELTSVDVKSNKPTPRTADGHPRDGHRPVARHAAWRGR